MRRLSLAVAALSAVLSYASGAAAQAPPAVRLPAEALAQDAAEYAARYGLSAEQALLRLQAQEESVAATDALAAEFGDRIAGIAIEHLPDYRIVVLLTGNDPVPERSISAGGLTIPILFRSGAPASRDAVVAAIRRRQAAIRSAFPRHQGLGADPRTGTLVMMVRARDVAAEDVAAVEAELTAVAGVPSRVRLLGGSTADATVEGGARVAGAGADGRIYYCTTGFVVTDGERTGIATAAHCPDDLVYQAPDGRRVPLTMVGAWGARYQDVQIHVGQGEPLPLFYADRDREAARFVTSVRPRVSTRAGDAVCHRGETTGYSCSEVELVDFAPPGDLCAGPCDPSWVTVAGPSCRSGDSGGPVFSGTTAFGIVKGSNRADDRGCSFYFYMSADYLPPGWRLVLGQPVSVAPQPAA